MEEKICDLIYRYSVNERIIDKDGLEELINIFKAEKVLENYIKGFTIIEHESLIEPGAVASYGPFSRTISVYQKSMNRGIEKVNKKGNFSSQFEKIFYINMLIVQIMLHELEHANQKKTIDNEKSLESDILKFSLSEKNIRLGMRLIDMGYSVEEVAIYTVVKSSNSPFPRNFSYFLDPQERLAEIKSYQLLLQAIEPIKDGITDAFSKEEYKFLKRLMSGYDRKLCPLFNYAIATDNRESLKTFPWWDRNYRLTTENVKKFYSLEDRLKYGLPIDLKEQEYCAKELSLVKK